MRRPLGPGSLGVESYPMRPLSMCRVGGAAFGAKILQRWLRRLPAFATRSGTWTSLAARIACFSSSALARMLMLFALGVDTCITGLLTRIGSWTTMLAAQGPAGAQPRRRRRKRRTVRSLAGCSGRCTATACRWMMLCPPLSGKIFSVTTCTRVPSWC